MLFFKLYAASDFSSLPLSQRRLIEYVMTPIIGMSPQESDRIRVTYEDNFKGIEIPPLLPPQREQEILAIRGTTPRDRAGQPIESFIGAPLRVNPDNLDDLRKEVKSRHLDAILDNILDYPDILKTLDEDNLSLNQLGTIVNALLSNHNTVGSGVTLFKKIAPWVSFDFLGHFYNLLPAGEAPIPVMEDAYNKLGVDNRDKFEPIAHPTGDNILKYMSITGDFNRLFDEAIRNGITLKGKVLFVKNTNQENALIALLEKEVDLTPYLPFHEKIVPILWRHQDEDLTLERVILIKKFIPTPHIIKLVKNHFNQELFDFAVEKVDSDENLKQSAGVKNDISNILQGRPVGYRPLVSLTILNIFNPVDDYPLFEHILISFWREEVFNLRDFRAFWATVRNTLSEAHERELGAKLARSISADIPPAYASEVLDDIARWPDVKEEITNIINGYIKPFLPEMVLQKMAEIAGVAAPEAWTVKALIKRHDENSIELYKLSRSYLLNSDIDKEKLKDHFLNDKNAVRKDIIEFLKLNPNKVWTYIDNNNKFKLLSLKARKEVIEWCSNQPKESNYYAQGLVWLKENAKWLPLNDLRVDNFLSEFSPENLLTVSIDEGYNWRGKTHKIVAISDDILRNAVFKWGEGSLLNEALATNPAPSIEARSDFFRSSTHIENIEAVLKDQDLGLYSFDILSILYKIWRFPALLKEQILNHVAHTAVDQIPNPTEWIFGLSQNHPDQAKNLFLSLSIDDRVQFIQDHSEARDLLLQILQNQNLKDYPLELLLEIEKGLNASDELKERILNYVAPIIDFDTPNLDKWLEFLEVPPYINQGNVVLLLIKNQLENKNYAALPRLLQAYNKPIPDDLFLPLAESLKDENINSYEQKPIAKKMEAEEIAKLRRLDQLSLYYVAICSDTQKNVLLDGLNPLGPTEKAKIQTLLDSGEFVTTYTPSEVLRQKLIANGFTILIPSN